MVIQYEKNTFYKIGKFIHIEYENGNVWDIIPSPLDFPNNTFEELLEGYEFPKPDYSTIFKDAKLEILDFSKYDSDNKIEK